MIEVEKKFGRSFTCAFEKEKTIKKPTHEKKHNNIRRGMFMKFPRVQILNRVTLFKILLINLKTAFPRIKWKS